jgi:hypothetical protein
MRFYFVAYAYRSSGSAFWNHTEALLKDEHPIAALIRWRARDREDNPHGTGSVQYALTSWQEITEDEYKLFDGQVG